MFSSTETRLTLPGNYRLQAVDARDERAIDAICRFRAAVWQATITNSGHKFHKDQLRDDWEASAYHWLIQDAQAQIVASARLIIAKTIQDVPESNQYLSAGLTIPVGTVAAPDRIVVSPNCSGRGFATLLLDQQDQAAENDGAVMAVRQASSRMARILRARDWCLAGPATPDPDFPGVVFTIAYRLWQQSNQSEVYPALRRSA